MNKVEFKNHEIEMMKLTLMKQLDQTKESIMLKEKEVKLKSKEEFLEKEKYKAEEIEKLKVKIR